MRVCISKELVGDTVLYLCSMECARTHALLNWKLEPFFVQGQMINIFKMSVYLFPLYL